MAHRPCVHPPSWGQVAHDTRDGVPVRWHAGCPLRLVELCRFECLATRTGDAGMSYTVLIIGLSGFGRWLARELHAAGHRVVGIDPDEGRVSRCHEWLDLGVTGDSAHAEVVERALDRIGRDSVDVAVVEAEALTRGILAVSALRELGVPLVIAEVDTPEAETALRALGVDDVVLPARDAAHSLAGRLPTLLQH